MILMDEPGAVSHAAGSRQLISAAVGVHCQQLPFEVPSGSSTGPLPGPRSVQISRYPSGGPWIDVWDGLPSPSAAQSISERRPRAFGGLAF